MLDLLESSFPHRRLVRGIRSQLAWPMIGNGTYRTVALILLETEATKPELMEFLVAWSRMTKRAIGEDQAELW